MAQYEQKYLGVFVRLAWILLLVFTALCFVFGLLDPVYLSSDSVAGDFGIAVLILGFATIGALILARSPENTVGWIFLTIVFLYVANQLISDFARFSLIKGQADHFWGLVAAWITSWLGIIFFAFITILPLLYFPNGRLLSPRWRFYVWFVISLITIQVIGEMLQPGPMDNFPGFDNPFGIPAARGICNFIARAANILGGAAIALSGISLILRFQRAEGIERLQIKWLAYGAAAPLILIFLVSIFVPDNPADPLTQVINYGLMLSLLMVPVSTGIAILRYRLYSIDLIIRRTLVYSILTSLLMLLYFGSVTILQALFTSLGGSHATIVTIISTLAIAALFNPLRRRIQDFIDRRFYRQKYDADKVLSEFAASARSETDLERLTGELLRGVQETIQPGTIMLWMQKMHSASPTPNDKWGGK